MRDALRLLLTVQRQLACASARAVRSLGVVRLLPRLDDCSRVGETAEPMQIQALITKLAVEAFTVGILGGFARFDAVERDAVRIRPGVQDAPSNLWTRVDRALLGRALGGDELVEHTRDSWAG